MKTTRFSIFLILLLVSTLYLSSTFAQDAAQWSLPNGVRARLGKGTIGAVQFSPDGTRLAGTGSIGVWIYDTDSRKELNLLTGHTEGDGTVNIIDLTLVASALGEAASGTRGG